MYDIIFDVGHYPPPKDTGAYNSNLDIREHNWSDMLAKACHYYSRINGLFSSRLVYRKTTLPELCQKINSLNPKFVVSFHLNAYHNSRATGTETWYWHTSSRSMKNAHIMQRHTVDVLKLTDRGAKPTSRLFQLGPATRASIVLIEPGFLTNNNDMKVLQDKFQLLFEAICKACVEILEEM